jgi:CDP-diacylglycerol--glycerol-3-phosphate 3-phosphatidyltransferase
MASLTLLLLVKDGGAGLGVGAEAAASLGMGLLLVASWLTVQSLAIYMKGLWRFMAAAPK